VKLEDLRTYIYNKFLKGNCQLITDILKMLGLYLHTLTTDHISCTSLSILNKLTLQRKLQNFVTNKFLDRKAKEQQNTKSNKKILAIDGN